MDDAQCEIEPEKSSDAQNAGMPYYQLEARDDNVYQLIAETIPHLVWTTTPDGYHDYFNERWEQYIGYRASETFGYRWHTFLHPDDQQRAQDTWSNCLNTGNPYEIEYRFKRYDGVYRWFLARAMPIRSPTGQIKKWFGTCTDIDEQKMAAHRRAELLILERQSRKAAEQASRTREELLAVVSHELRTPLMSILGWSELLQRGKLKPDRYEVALEAIVRSARTQASLVDDLLDVSQIFVGNSNGALQKLNFAELVRREIETGDPGAQTNKIRITFTSAQNILVIGCEKRLSQVIRNLISNAIKFTPPNGSVNVNLAQDDKDAVLTVVDSGVGIAADVISKIFDSFQQGHAGESRAYGGLGLGLTIAKRIVENHNGNITAFSDGLGNGSTFVVRLPCAFATDALNLHSATEKSYACGEIPDDALAGLSVLVVEDDESTRNVLNEILGTSGAEVLLATSAEDGRTVLARRAIDVIICDIGMPSETGYEFIANLKAIGICLPSIALTSYARPIDAERALREGFDKHLTKPINDKQLIKEVAILSGRESWIGL